MQRMTPLYISTSPVCGEGCRYIEYANPVIVDALDKLKTAFIASFAHFAAYIQVNLPFSLKWSKLLQ